MKILQVNKFWYPQGGADVYCLNLTHALEEEGHEVARFGMQHPENEPSPWNRFFVSQSDYAHDRPTLRAALRFIWNREAKKKFAALVAEFQPDVIHVHNAYHQLTGSILPVARKSGALVVMTMHDYKLLSPNYTMYADGRITEATRIHKYYRILSRRASDESFARRIILMLEAYTTWVFGVYRKNIDVLVAPALAIQRMLQEYRVAIPSEFILNWVNVTPASRAEAATPRKPYLLYVGRLSSEKGLATLLRAAEKLPQEQFVVIGDGPARPMQWPANVTWKGSQPRSEVLHAMSECRALIVPSEWYEVNSLVIPEAHALGTWVIAANTGTIDVLDDGKNGWWFEMGNADDLVEKIEQLATANTTFDPFLHITRQEHLAQLLAIYQRSLTPRGERVYTKLPVAAQTQEV